MPNPHESATILTTSPIYLMVLLIDDVEIGQFPMPVDPDALSLMRGKRTARKDNAVKKTAERAPRRWGIPLIRACYGALVEMLRNAVLTEAGVIGLQCCPGAAQHAVSSGTKGN
jgi:hypothetical protein